ncbi:hypothetical protein OG342_05070 [Streptomyces bobili]|uniref:hypothetical protein n=1 Tax=Streptomyces bobili TaxID=67280 RepID=UPI00224D6A02|nr:hypothetical protein [Streptomyces bobili]MCX5522239.1 hypothetical protein [Streptomyces bobili]
MTEQPITDQQLNEYDDLCAAATPGPWAHTDSSAIVAPLSADKIADVWEPTGLSRNGDFIEATRTAMPALIAEVRRLQAELAAVTALCDEQDMAARMFELPQPAWIRAVRAAINTEEPHAAPAAAAGESGSTR